MSQVEYVHYTDCRQASFSYKKQVRFLSWIHASSFFNGRIGNDAADVLGFLGFDFVLNLTEKSLSVKKEWEIQDRLKAKDSMTGSKKYLFGTNETTQTPLQPAHIMEAVRLLTVQGKRIVI